MTFTPAQEAEAHARLRAILDEMRAVASAPPAEATAASVRAGDVEPGMTIRIEEGPKAGTVGRVVDRIVVTQLGTNFRVAILVFDGGSRSVRPAGEKVTVLR